MILLNSLKDVKLGQLLGWKFKDLISKDENLSYWTCVSQVSGFHKLTRYPVKMNNGLVYTTKEKIDHKIIAILSGSVGEFILGANHKNEIETNYIYEKEWDIWLLENEKDYLEVIKHIMAANL